MNKSSVTLLPVAILLAACAAHQPPPTETLVPTSTQWVLPSPTCTPTHALTSWPVYTLQDVGLTMRYPPDWAVRESPNHSPQNLVMRSVGFVPPRYAKNDFPQVPHISLAVYRPPLTDTLRAWLDAHSTAKPFGSPAGPEVHFFGVNDITEVKVGGLPALRFTHDVFGFTVHELLLAMGETAASLGCLDLGAEDLEPAFLQMQESLALVPPTQALPLPTDTPAPTLLEAHCRMSTATPATDAFAHFRRLMERWPETIPEAHRTLLEGIVVFLGELPGGLKTLLAEPECLAVLYARIGPTFFSPAHTLQAADLDDDSAPELLVAVVPPVSIVRQTSEGLVVDDLPGAVYWPPDNTWPSIEQVTDLTGDGRPEIVLAYIFIGASHTGTELLVVGQEEDRWAEWLRVVLDNWAGGGEWWLEPQPDGTQAVVTTCAVFGVFDAKMVGHPLQRDTYRWDGQRFVLVASEQDPPSTRREVINIAEAALRAGAYRAALTTYHRLLDEPSLPDEPQGGTAQGKPDWVAYAALRMGQIHTLLGEREAALEMLSQAEEAGSTVGRLAQRFREAYEATADPAAAWRAMLTDTQIYAEQYSERGNLVSFPGDAFGALYPGMALAAVLNDHPEALDGNPEALRAAWAEYSLEAGATLMADLDGDSQDEVVAIFLPPEPSLTAGWVLDQGPDGWFAALLERFEGSTGARLEGPLPVPGTTRLAVRVGTRVRGWDGEQIIRYRDTQTWMVETDPMQCPVRWPQR